MSAKDIRSKESLKSWIKKNPCDPNLSNAMKNSIKYFLALEQAIPKWVNWFKVSSIYKYSESLRKSGVNVHVHHIIPIRSKLVCGLHCEDNLVVIPEILNLQLSNAIWPDMWIDQADMFGDSAKSKIVEICNHDEYFAIDIRDIL